MSLKIPIIWPLSTIWKNCRHRGKETERRRMCSAQTYKKSRLCFNEGWAEIKSMQLTLLETHFPHAKSWHFRPAFTHSMNRCHYSLSHLSLQVWNNEVSPRGRIKIGSKTFPSPPSQEVPGIGHHMAMCSKRGNRSQGFNLKNCSSEMLFC